MNDFLPILKKDIISHKQAIEKAEKIEIYREREMRQLESDFDKAVKMLVQISDDK